MIPVLKPTIDKQTKKELLKVLDSGWWGFGPKTQEFERKFAKYVGANIAWPPTPALRPWICALRFITLEAENLSPPR